VPLDSPHATADNAEYWGPCDDSRVSSVSENWPKLRLWHDNAVCGILYSGQANYKLTSIFGSNSLIWRDITILTQNPCPLLRAEFNEGSHDPGDLDLYLDLQNAHMCYFGLYLLVEALLRDGHMTPCWTPCHGTHRFIKGRSIFSSKLRYLFK